MSETKRKYRVCFEKDRGKYKGNLYVECNELSKSLDNNSILIIDGTKIRIDKKIKSIEEIK